MRKTLALLLAAAVLLAGCPKKQPTFVPPKPPLEFTIVVVCTDIATFVRVPDQACLDGEPGYWWLYIRDHPSWPAELPAVGERLENGRGDPALPIDGPIGHVPTEGGYFVRADI
jgi:predicted small lipoprotein YifL